MSKLKQLIGLQSSNLSVRALGRALGLSVGAVSKYLRAVRACGIEAAEAEDPLLAGVRLVRSELGAALARLGIEAFAPSGELFDPNQHEAMAQQPVDGAVSGTVAEVYQPGYRMGETIIRPARVLVAA